MELTFKNKAIVVVGDAVSVGLIHHELLRRLDVVPGDWGAPVAPSVMTPDASVVSYGNGVSLLAHPRRLQVSATSGEGRDDSGGVADLATKLLRMLPAGPLSAVGVNAVLLIPAEDPAERLGARFLREDAVPEAMGKPTGFGCTISLDVADARLTVAFQPADQPAPGIQVNANYHTVVESVDEACSAVSRFDERMQALQGILSALLGM